MSQFAEFDDAAAEFEGVIPSSREAWIIAKIDSVESRLIGLVPSLATVTRSSDPTRYSRAKHLVVEKVLELYRNPSGAQQQTAGPFSTAYSSTVSSGRIAFTAEELATVRLRTHKNNLGTVTVKPWRAQEAPGVLRWR